MIQQVLTLVWAQNKQTHFAQILTEGYLCLAKIWNTWKEYSFETFIVTFDGLMHWTDHWNHRHIHWIIFYRNDKLFTWVEASRMSSGAQWFGTGVHTNVIIELALKSMFILPSDVKLRLSRKTNTNPLTECLISEDILQNILLLLFSLILSATLCHTLLQRCSRTVSESTGL